MTEATWCEGQVHDDLVDQALANNELRDSLARQWRLVRVETAP